MVYPYETTENRISKREVLRKVANVMEVIYHTATNDEVDRGYQAPKNIRQVGSPAMKQKIYIEDYVVTYLTKLAMPSNTYARGAILLGKVKKTEEGVYIFINGALEAQNFELDLDETVFTNENWADIYDQIRRYFPELEIVGWFVSRLGFSTDLNDKIIKTHLNYFAGQNKVLYMIDSLEDEDTFYLFDNGSLKKQRGYYIYFEKNEEMQSYMIVKNEEVKPKLRERSNVIERDQAVINSFRKTLDNRTKSKRNNYKKKKVSTVSIEKKNDKKENGFFYTASTFLTVAILAVGITVINNYDKMLLLESTINQMANEIKGESKEVIANIPTETKEKDSIVSTDTVASTELEEKEIKPTKNTETMEQTTGEEIRQEENTKLQETVVNQIVTYYIVKEGDTLIGISKKMYKSGKYVDDILTANKMKEKDKIFPGQKIIIPTIE